MHGTLTYEELLEAYLRLQEENIALKSELSLLKGIDKVIVSEVSAPKAQPTVHLSLEEKVALFRSLFRGREDVFARRWYSRSTGKLVTLCMGCSDLNKTEFSLLPPYRFTIH